MPDWFIPLLEGLEPTLPIAEGWYWFKLMFELLRLLKDASLGEFVRFIMGLCCT